MLNYSPSLVFLEILAGYVICGLIAIIGFVVVWKIATGQIDVSKILTEKDGSPGGAASMSRFQLLIFIFVIAALMPKAPPKAPGTVFHASHKAAACAVNLNACPEIGCETEGTPHALVNQMKRRIPNSLSPKTLTWEDFVALQQDADSTVGEN